MSGTPEDARKAVDQQELGTDRQASFWELRPEGAGFFIAPLQTVPQRPGGEATPVPREVPRED